MRAIPVHDLAGEARDIGLAHGRLLRDEIRECIEIYRLVLGTGDAPLMREAERIATTVCDFSPQIADEIDAIAEGSGVDPRWVYVLNARSELVTSRGDGCTAVFVPERGLLGQTWDWIDALEPLVVVLRIERAGGHRLMTLTEPGIVAKIGCNGAGMGVCLNFMYSPGPHHGVPVHVLLRACLDAESLAEARAVTSRAGAGRAANVLVGTGGSGGFDVEYTGQEARVVEIDRSPFVHTNHVDERPETARLLWGNSTARALRARELAGDARDLTALVRVLDDRGDAENPICTPYRSLLGAMVGTTATVAMELRDARMHARLGPRPGAPMQRIDLQAEP